MPLGCVTITLNRNAGCTYGNPVHNDPARRTHNIGHLGGRVDLGVVEAPGICCVTSPLIALLSHVARRWFWKEGTKGVSLEANSN